MDASNRSSIWSEIFEHGVQQLVEHGRTSPADFQKLFNVVAEFVLESLTTNSTQLLDERRQFVAGFEKRLVDRWGKAIDLFEIALTVAQEAGQSKNSRQRPHAAATNDLVFDVLIRLQARACLTASEVLVLLRTGHAAGAHARWRTLHELAVMAYFIRQNGNDVAERYLLHHIVESYKAALLYEKHHIRLGYEPLGEGEVDRLRQKRDELAKKFGRGFLEDYGWAFDVFGRRPTLSDLEDRVGLGHMRPFYKMASHGIHANAKGALWNLGAASTGEMMLAGPSNAGIADPGHGALISLHQVNTTTLNCDPDFEDLIAMLVLGKLVELAGSAFLEAHKQLERDELEYQKDNNN